VVNAIFKEDHVRRDGNTLHLYTAEVNKE